jgi:hypothetical protein
LGDTWRGTLDEEDGKKRKEQAMPAEAHGEPRAPLDVALTPRPVRLLLVGQVNPGDEGRVREAQAHFPTDAAAGAGIGAIEAFIGSGYYALELEIDSDDVQDILAAYFNDPRVRAFHASLEPMVSGLPRPDVPYGPTDRFHDGEPAASSPRTAQSSADLPLAAGMYRWRVGEPPTTGERPHGRLERV